MCQMWPTMVAFLVACGVLAPACYSSIASDETEAGDDCLGSCLGRECGGDRACGVSCGTCPAGHDCSADGFCVPRCLQPYCDEVFVPAGPFLMGCDSSDCMDVSRWRCSDAQPKHVVWLSAYWIDKYEVTYDRYNACVDAGGCTPHVDEESFRNPTYRNHPTSELSFPQMDRYCRWIGRMMPTEAQWEKAARGGCEIGGDPETCEVGVDDRPYPWGWDTPTCEHAMSPLCVGPDTLGHVFRPVGLLPAGASPYGALDMLDNAFEVVSDVWLDGGYQECLAGCQDPTGPAPPFPEYHTRVVRGGGGVLPPPYRTHICRREPAGYYYIDCPPDAIPVDCLVSYYGFRCARPAGSGP